MDIILTPRAEQELLRRGGIAAIDYVPAIAWGGFPEVSVDTYLKGKSLQRYRTVMHDDVKLLVAPALYAQARSIRLEVNDFLLWKSLRAEVEPVGGHFHSPACRH